MTQAIFSEASILALQIVASFFMAADYFLSEDERKPVNQAIGRAAAGFRRRITTQLEGAFAALFVTQLSRTLVALAFLATAWAGLDAFAVVGTALPPWVTAGAMLLLLGLFAGAAPCLLELTVLLAIPAMLAMPLWLSAWFVDYCRKGSVFGIGLLFLMASFACRYANLQ